MAEEETLVLDESGVNAVPAETLEREPTNPDIPQSVFDLAYLRRSQEDLKLVLEALKEHGAVTVVPDEEPPVEEPEPEEPVE